MAIKRIFITSGSTVTLPADWNPRNNQVECYGSAANASGQNGGGGGAYATAFNIPVNPNSSVHIGVGTPGGTADTWFNATSLANAVSNGSTLSVGAQGASGTTGGAGSSSVGSTAYSGGNGGGSTGGSDGGGGGGAAGPNGNGKNGGNSPTGSASGGGGGANNGSGGGTGVSTTPGGGAGGNGRSGLGGGSPNSGNASTGTGGGGAGGSNSDSSPSGGNGALDDVYGDGLHGPGGGGGGAAFATGFTGVVSGNGGGYGSGAGGIGSGSSVGTSQGGLIVLTYTPLAAPLSTFPVQLSHPQPTSWLALPFAFATSFGFGPTPGPTGFWTQPPDLQCHPVGLQPLQRGNISGPANIAPNITPGLGTYFFQPPDLVNHPKPFSTAFGFTPNPTVNPNPVTPTQLAFFTQAIPLAPPPSAPPYQIQIRAWPPLFVASAFIKSKSDQLNAIIVETPGTGTSNDVSRRISLVIPFRWFGNPAPIKDAVVGGISDAASWSYSWIPYIRNQLRVVSATGPWLDVIAFDYFNINVLRKNGQSDSAFRTVIQKELIRERVTRKGMIQAILDLTGRSPIIFEPWNTGDAGCWDSGAVAWDAGLGAWGDTILPSQSFIRVFRPGLQGIPAVGAWDTGFAAWDGGVYSYWCDQSQVVGAVTDTDIYRTINLTKPTGSVIWTQLQ